VDGKSNEITAIPQVLGLLDLHGAVVSIDAMGCQKAIAEKATQGGADHVLALKDNHPQLREDVGLWLDTEAGKGALAAHETVEKDHGRIEIRRYVLSGDLDWLAQKPEWAGLRAVGRVESTRIVGGQASTEHRYYLSSLAGLERFADVVRGHWATGTPTPGAGRAVRRGRQPRPQGPFGGKPRPGAAHGPERHPPQRTLQAQPARPQAQGLAQRRLPIRADLRQAVYIARLP
jgi:predicted transposase YbfD/YdcC